MRCKLLRMKRFLLLAVALPSALLAGRSDPGAPFVAADEAYSQSSVRDGAWTAARRFSIAQTETFVPRRVKMLEYGKDEPDPPYAMSWKTEHAWTSCDGTIGVTYGTWKVAGLKLGGWYESVWTRMRDGSFRILMRHANDTPIKLFSKPGRKGMRAACGGPKPSLPITAPDVGTDYKLGASNDQTLVYSSAVSAKGEVRIVISLWNGTAFVPVLEDVAPAPASR